MNNQFNFQDVVELYLMSALRMTLILEDDSTDGSSYVQHLGLSIPLLDKEGIPLLYLEVKSMSGRV